LSLAFNGGLYIFVQLFYMVIQTCHIEYMEPEQNFFLQTRAGIKAAQKSNGSAKLITIFHSATMIEKWRNKFAENIITNQNNGAKKQHGILILEQSEFSIILVFS
jgi:hypothetical protein